MKRESMSKNCSIFIVYLTYYNRQDFLDIQVPMKLTNILDFVDKCYSCKVSKLISSFAEQNISNCVLSYSFLNMIRMDIWYIHRILWIKLIYLISLKNNSMQYFTDINVPFFDIIKKPMKTIFLQTTIGKYANLWLIYLIAILWGKVQLLYVFIFLT